MDASNTDGLPTEVETIREVDAEGTSDAASSFRLREFGQRYARGHALGMGGMGEVRTWTDRASGRDVAMKTIRTDREEPNSVQRFAREARIQAQLEHPSIVPVYDVGVDDTGGMFFTMKRVRGHSLARVLATAWDRGEVGSYSLRKLLSVIARVAMAVEFAHRRGVVNRDLKPNNIMLGAFDEVYVIDWGLAALHDSQVAPLSRPEIFLGLPMPDPSLDRPLVDSSQRPETKSGQMIGTPGYAAPEQVQNPTVVDRRSDVYALGVILFEILAGQRMHQGDSLAHVLMSTFKTDGASPAERAPDRGIPPEIDALCRRATRLDPAARPQSAAEIAKEIERYLDGDRDLERRRELASTRARAAAEAFDASRTLGDEDARRSVALREAGSALALDPENREARRTLLRVLTTPPRVTPRDAEIAHRRSGIRSFRTSARIALAALLTYALYVPVVFWMGLRHPWMFGVTAAAILTLIGLTYHYYRKPPADLDVPWPHLVSSTVALASGVWFFGSLVTVPAIALATGVAYTTTFRRRAIYCVPPFLAVVIGPLILQYAGVLPDSYAFEGGSLRIVPGMVDFPPAATMTFLVMIHIVTIGAALWYMWRLRAEYLDVERKLHLQAWQLAQLVPDDARAALAASTPGGMPTPRPVKPA
ncbi:MAG TPA: serine/threonine-protein kinase [Kofleriaceae bacterium]|nr:serine/threonine-protein kinase [Kofleriaceae bacterium]